MIARGPPLAVAVRGGRGLRGGPGRGRGQGRGRGRGRGNNAGLAPLDDSGSEGEDQDPALNALEEAFQVVNLGILDGESDDENGEENGDNEPQQNVLPQPPRYETINDIGQAQHALNYDFESGRTNEMLLPERFRNWTGGCLLTHLKKKLFWVS